MVLVAVVVSVLVAVSLLIAYNVSGLPQAYFFTSSALCRVCGCWNKMKSKNLEIYQKVKGVAIKLKKRYVYDLTFRQLLKISICLCGTLNC